MLVWSEIVAGLIVAGAICVALRYFYRVLRGKSRTGCAACDDRTCPLRDLKNRTCPDSTKR